MLPHSPGDFITNMEQFFSIIIKFKSMSFSGLARRDSSAVEASWPVALLLRLSTLGRSQRDFIASAVIFARKWLAHLISQNTRSTSHPRQSGAFRLKLWASQFLFLSESQHYIVAFGLVGPILRAVFVTLFSFEFIPSLFILLPGRIYLVWLGFA